MLTQSTEDQISTDFLVKILQLGKMHTIQHTERTHLLLAWEKGQRSKQLAHQYTLSSTMPLGPERKPWIQTVTAS